MCEREHAEEFTGRSSAMRAENRWLGAEDIYGYGDVKVTIAGVVRYLNVKFESGRVKKEVFALRFEGKKKQLVLSPTKRRPIITAFGTDTRDWIGKVITLYVDTDVPKPGCPSDRTWGIRVRKVDKSQQPASKPPPPQQEAPPPQQQPEPTEPPPKTSTMPADPAQWLGAITALESIEACVEFRELLGDCPGAIRPQIETALADQERILTGGGT